VPEALPGNTSPLLNRQMQPFDSHISLEGGHLNYPPIIFLASVLTLFGSLRYKKLLMCN
jgi:hypothetical protein